MRFDWIAVVICLLAVVGLYFLFCKLLGGLAGRRYIMALRAEEYDDDYEMLCAWHTAQMMATVSRDSDGTPVILTDNAISMKLFTMLRDEGIAVYRRMDG